MDDSFGREKRMKTMLESALPMKTGPSKHPSRVISYTNMTRSPTTVQSIIPVLVITTVLGCGVMPPGQGNE
ncbi:hypothetical protein KIN20_026281 [Parelaphostrongylus tenuis]|uniref:Uncharacterized protein n=1 Tax=Parelaphostrongylus tenuis TaxID=148309 RepID=A0AAD5NCI6_PARTN|nr:hypothetical protein KIN20_026281 [Parelaphostrongylus tenuis]